MVSVVRDTDLPGMDQGSCAGCEQRVDGGKRLKATSRTH